MCTSEFVRLMNRDYEVDFSRRSAGSRVSGTDEANGPADDHDEDPESDWAVPKLGQETVRV